MKISQQMIAEYSGVSRGTVDRVLHGKPNVKPETREKVLEAIRKLGYSPNMFARALSLSKREYSICVILPDNFFFKDVATGINAALNELCDYNLSVSYIVTKDKTTAGIADEIKNSTSDAFMAAVRDSSDIAEALKEKSLSSVPVITFNSDIRDSGRLSFIGQDLYKSGRIAADLMLKLTKANDEKLLIVTGNNSYKAHRERVSGFCDIINESGKNLNVADIIETNDDYELTLKLVSEALDKDEKISGIYMAAGNGEALAKLLSGRKKYNVVVNDLYPAAENALKKGIFDFTILQNPFEQGYKPVKLLFDLLFNGKEPEEEYYYTNNTVITREML